MANPVRVPGSLLTARDVAGLLGVSTETVLRWVRAGKLPAIRLPSGAIRFGGDQLDAWLIERATPGRGVSPAPANAAQPLGYALSPVPEVEE
jgi:excisionase family DNA binding protein